MASSEREIEELKRRLQQEKEKALIEGARTRTAARKSER
jgi:hypothetical protein